MGFLTTEQQSQLRAVLIKDKTDLEMHLALHHPANEKWQSASESVGELSNYDNHPGDLGSELYEREKDIALHKQVEQRLANVEQALQRMDDNNYGTCELCRQPIPFERLLAVPATVHCVNHTDPGKRTRERTFLDEISDHLKGGRNADSWAWHTVALWGTSNTPAMADSPEISKYNDFSAEDDEHDGYVQVVESFLATDMSGKHITFIRNDEYYKYLEDGEGDRSLETGSPDD